MVIRSISRVPQFSRTPLSRPGPLKPSSQRFRTFATTTPLSADFTHAIIGGGAVGLAIARKLSQKNGTSTVLIERNSAVGMETSSRNSEVIHAGLYYGEGSLKTKLCIKGKNMLYELCEKYAIPCRNMGKWIVAQTAEQLEEIHKVHKFATQIGVPTHFVPLEKAAELEPHVQAKTGILASPTTGIIDSHSYMQYLLGAFEEAGGDVALNSTVTSITPLGSSPGSSGYKITVTDKGTGEESTITAETLINSAGLGACDVQNMVLPESRWRKQYYAKGNYFAYSASSPSTKHLIYPAPEPGLGGLGTHLTLDISGRIKFGPDVEWVDNCDDLSVNTSRFDQAVEQIKRFLPGIDESRLVPDYAGIRPKLGRMSAVGSGKGFQDFVIQNEEGYGGFVNLVGIESPGLTSSLAIAEEVEGLLYGGTEFV